MNIAFVAQRHQDKQLFVNILTAGEAQPLQGRHPWRDGDKVGLFSRLEVANPLIETQRAGSSQRSMVKRFAGAQTIALQLCHFIGFTQSA